MKRITIIINQVQTFHLMEDEAAADVAGAVWLENLSSFDLSSLA
jgi:hypothetical protein